MPALRDTPPDYRQHLEIETPEHVVLDLEIAGIGSPRARRADRHGDPGGRGRSRRCSPRNPLGLRRAARPGGAGAAHCSARSWSGTATSSCSKGSAAARRPGKRIAGIRVVSDTGHAGDASALPSRGTCSGSPTSCPRPTSPASCSPRSTREASGWATWSPAPSSSATGPPAVRRRPERGRRPTDDRPRRSDPRADRRRVPPAGRVQPRVRPSSDAAGTDALAAGLAARLADAPRAARQSRRGAPARAARRRAGPPAGRLSARGARRPGPAPASPRRSAPAGTSSSGWPSARRSQGLDSFGAARAPGLRRPLPRGGRRPRPGPHLPRRSRHPARLERLVAAGHNALYRDERTPGARSGSCSRANARRPWSQAVGYVLLAFLIFTAAGRGRLRPAARAARPRRRALPGRHAPAGGGRDEPQGRRGGATWTWRRRTGRSWPRASSPTTSGSPSHASPAASSSAWAPWCCWRTTGSSIGAFAGPLRQRRAARLPARRSSWATARWSCSPSGWRARPGFLLGRSVVAPGTAQSRGRAGAERPARASGWWARRPCC